MSKRRRNTVAAYSPVLALVLVSQLLVPSCRHASSDGSSNQPDANPSSDADIDGDTDVDSDADSDSDSDAYSDSDVDADSDTDTAIEDTDTGPSPCAGDDPVCDWEVDACCTDPGQEWYCWWEDAEADGVTCSTDGECPSGNCNGDHGLCSCDNDEDCSDGVQLFGVCNLDVEVCVPSWCNGIYICSCWGGCQWWSAPEDTTYAEWCEENYPGRVCCEGSWSAILDPGDDIGCGYCGEP